MALDAERWARQWRRPVSWRLWLRLLLFEPGFQLAFAIRLIELLGNLPVIGLLLRRLVWLWTTRAFACDIAIGLRAGGGLYFPHPYAIVINGAAVLGGNVTVHQGVTIGIESDPNPAVPVIEDDVVLGAGACILGGITLGRGAMIGANAVVLADVPAGRVAVGVPARILGQGKADVTPPTGDRP